MAERASLKHAEAAEAAEVVFAGIRGALAEGEPGDGLEPFTLRERASRSLLNPPTGAPVVVEAGRVSKFKDSPALREAIRPEES